ncbi:hypothetical protein A3Q34_03520 [Colwellia sp. PAMC 20917]|uniref:hypothetical protein n=1 Tax=Colwellia sp. PAMC 20917 TaxID=1816218 RepID=UPI00087914B0|nr:hypothetical protein [Colwellia sp. PAMC 20917]AOW76007.1 hypothetical protein A3Q34_03520 [Colwellia sp. PAMC 20917]
MTKHTQKPIKSTVTPNNPIKNVYLTEGLVFPDREASSINDEAPRTPVTTKQSKSKYLTEGVIFPDTKRQSSEIKHTTTLTTQPDAKVASPKTPKPTTAIYLTDCIEF